jgi:hypothetical protein
VSGESELLGGSRFGRPQNSDAAVLSTLRQLTQYADLDDAESLAFTDFYFPIQIRAQVVGATLADATLSSTGALRIAGTLSVALSNAVLSSQAALAIQAASV